jgi:hypothetical protein
MQPRSQGIALTAFLIGGDALTELLANTTLGGEGRWSIIVRGASLDYSPAFATRRATAATVSAGEPAPGLASPSLVNNPG